MTTQQTLNPFAFSNLKHHAIPFDAVVPEQILPQLQKAIDQAKVELLEIENNPEPPTFENTILALETCGESIDLISAIYYNLLHAHTNDHLQKMASEVGPRLANYSSDLLLNEKIFLRVKSVNEKPENLSSEQKQLLDKYHSNFTRNGALLPAEKKNRLRQIDSDMSKLGPAFSENVLKATNEFVLFLNQESDLKGLPDSLIQAARITAKEKGRDDAWAFTLQAPSYVPFMQFSENRSAREIMYRAFASRANNDKFDNKTNLMKIVELREERARLLGYKNHAHFVLEKRMAENTEQVMSFLTRLKDASLKTAKNEVQTVAAFSAKNGGPSNLMPWDFAFWSEKLKEHLFQFKEEELRPYFQLEKVVQGVFKHAELLYGIEFKKTHQYPVYHPDVTVYEVIDQKSQKYLGLFYTDFFPRESKNGGAWMTNYYEQGLFENHVHRPHVAIVCNFTKPLPDKPSLLSLDEVHTLFHEFGHALHSLLSQCTYRSLSGTNVYWDFVELPSQIMENWVQEKESLDLFAEHYKTGEKIPPALAQKIKDSAKFLAGYATLRQVTFALLDMHWHTTDYKDIQNPIAFEEKIVAPLRVLPSVEGTNFSCAFSHIFAGGYSAGYYSYKWAEVLDADAFELFKERGLFDKDTASRFKENILSRGGSEHPMELYKKFRGRAPNPDALLKRDGLL